MWIEPTRPLNKWAFRISLVIMGPLILFAGISIVRDGFDAAAAALIAYSCQWAVVTAVYQKYRENNLTRIESRVALVLLGIGMISSVAWWVGVLGGWFPKPEIRHYAFSLLALAVYLLILLAALNGFFHVKRNTH